MGMMIRRHGSSVQKPADVKSAVTVEPKETKEPAKRGRKPKVE